ncbi:TIGR00730 family Rossman fold protein [Vagococcus xieshaowenii]|uniref:Cytokinin riboside 5'-monophosphate phosphoribohydrolase n=1 Tax=Vagococcus xieshaowenii TaxID=2562451 RepID=A0A4Z0D7I5_9ENTE|nr:TIGR00730 family Rossman fold protein [Vagococcus xieshaowenii]QCA29180.1 TIGR00730 family Rossman fold protein [Vagococcus xieshaowenii]TFZ40842.1 TIGR00730 family Rossman fold protein [Vagococcus xieshaowenii]
MTTIAVYCASAMGTHPIYAEKAHELGQWMTEESYDLVYGGSKLGLMGVLARELIQAERQTIGVMPNFLADNEITQEGLSELIYVESMHERKQKMIDLADVFIAMPGGPGTLEEISEVVSWSRIGQHDKPCIFYNVNGYYDLLAQFFDRMVTDGFLFESDREALLFSDSLTEIQSFIKNYTPPAKRVYDK